MSSAPLILRLSIKVSVAIIVLSLSPLLIGMLSVILANVLGCDFTSGASTSVLCEPQIVRRSIEVGIFLNWFALATLPVGMIAFVVLLILLVLRAFVRQ